MPIIACKRCKAKKLKCDNEPRVCRNCRKAGSPCLSIDARSRREYARGYVEDLQDRIRHLNAVIRARSSAGDVPPPDGLSSPSESPLAQSTYHGEGSSISMARLVEAAVGVKTTDTPLTNLCLQTGDPQEENTNVDDTPATLPPMEMATQLVDSYLNGPHLLHPFLRRSTLLKEIDCAYALTGCLEGPEMFRVYMVFAIGAVSLVRAGLHCTPAMNYYVAAMKHEKEALGLGSGLEHVQALLLILMFSLQHDIGIGSKWDLSRVAMRICVENGYHRRSSNSLSPMMDQMQRRVFWACYISDRHSSSVLGRPVALQDRDIDAELPIDADDDLIESGNVDVQIFRGASEVSAQLRQIHLRQITSRIGTKVYRKPATHELGALQVAVNDILAELDEWRDLFPILSDPQSSYETTQWRDLNYYRERLKCFRPLVLLGKGGDIKQYRSSLAACQEATDQVGTLYRAMRASEKLVLNWTCVHDMMSAGFTALYCGLAQMETFRKHGMSERFYEEALEHTRETTGYIVDTLSHIAEKWSTVKRHVGVFKALASQVTESMQSTALSAAEPNAENLVTNDYQAPENHNFVNWDRDVGHQADVWDAAMVAFLNEPLDLGNIEWGAIDWDGMGLFHGDQ